MPVICSLEQERINTCWPLRTSVTWILIILNTKNPESDIGINTEDQRSRVVCHWSVLTSSNAQVKRVILSPRILRHHPQTESSNCIWAPVSSCPIFLSLPSHIIPVSTSPVLGLKACHCQTLGIKVWGDTTLELFLDLSCVAQSSLELAGIRLPVLQILRLKVCATTSWPLVA